MTKVLIVVTNHSKLGDTGKTGWYLPEVAHPYAVFTDAGYDVTFVSPNGGEAPMDPGSYEAFKNDKISMDFFNKHMSLCKETKPPHEIDGRNYKVIFYAGGHGPMFDLPTCEPIAKLGKDVYENGGIVGAVCHGTVGLLPIILSNGDRLLKGRTVTSFTNAEEEVVKLTDAMPFPLETQLVKYGATFVGKNDFASNVQEDQRIVTGQNPASASATAEAIVKLVK